MTEYIELKRRRTYWNGNLTFCSPLNTSLETENELVT